MDRVPETISRVAFGNMDQTGIAFVEKGSASLSLRRRKQNVTYFRNTIATRTQTLKQVVPGKPSQLGSGIHRRRTQKQKKHGIHS